MPIFGDEDYLIFGNHIQSNIRSEVQWFTGKMEEKLKANDHKGGWKDCDVKYLLFRLVEEMQELENAVFDDELSDNIVNEAADVANIAMMIADIVAKSKR